MFIPVTVLPTYNFIYPSLFDSCQIIYFFCVLYQKSIIWKCFRAFHIAILSRIYVYSVYFQHKLIKVFVYLSYQEQNISTDYLIDATANTVFLCRGRTFPWKPWTNKLPVPIQAHWVEKLKVPYKWLILSWWHIPNELWYVV